MGLTDFLDKLGMIQGTCQQLINLDNDPKSKLISSHRALLNTQ